jgi:hypothetical protein
MVGIEQIPWLNDAGMALLEATGLGARPRLPARVRQHAPLRRRPSNRTDRHSPRGVASHRVQ